MARINHLLLLSLLLTTTTITAAASDPPPPPPPPPSPDGTCLTLFHKSINSPKTTLLNWTNPTNLLNPCPLLTSQSPLLGITCNNGRVFKLTLPSLSLTGTIPPFSLSQCTNLQTLDLSSNSLTGPIPYSIFNNNLLNLAILNLSHNQFTGTIPSQISLCTYLNVVDLHSNLLSGSIPQQLGYLSRLTVFDVSWNRLSGAIPTNLAVNGRSEGRFNRSSFEGNPDLYGFPLEEKGEVKGSKSGGGLSVLAIVGIGLGSGFLSLVVSFTVVCIWLRVSEQRLADAAAIQQQQGIITSKY